MEELPPEVLMVILPYFGGRDFVNFRRTCKRHRDIADHLEYTARPALWRGYLFQDYPHPCLESVVPWLYVEDKNNPVLWKNLYVKLTAISYLHGSSLNFTHLSLDSLEADDVKFFYNYLFVLESRGNLRLIGLKDHLWKWPKSVCFSQAQVSPLRPHYFSKCVGVFKHDSRAFKLICTGVSDAGSNSTNPCDLLLQGQLVASCKEWNFQQLPSSCDNGKKGACISHWANFSISYRKEYLSGETDFTVCNHADRSSSYRIQMKTPVHGLRALSFNDKRVVALCADNAICFIPNSSTSPVNVYSYPLESEVLKVCMVGDLVVMLLGNGKIETAQVLTDGKGKMYLSERQILLDENSKLYGNLIMSSHKVTDFVIVGQVFAAILGNGSVFLSFFETVNHACLEKNLQEIFQVPLTCEDQSLMLRLSMSQEQGLVLAMMETYMGEAGWASTLHVLYIDRAKQTS